MKFALALVLALASSASAFNGLNFGGRGRGGIRRSIRKSPFNNKGGFGTNGNIGGNGQPPINNDGGLNADASDGDGDAKEDGQGLWAAYNNKLETNPILTKALTSMIGFTLGDILAQNFVEKKGEYDIMRTIRLASFGFLIHGTTGHWFYGKLDKAIPGTGAMQVFSKVGIDQVLWNPIFGVMFFSYMGFTNGDGPAAVAAKVKRDLMTQVTGSWTVWPIAHAINFRFIPTSQRLLYINTIQIFYNVFLSIIGNKE